MQSNVFKWQWIQIAMTDEGVSDCDYRVVMEGFRVEVVAGLKDDSYSSGRPLKDNQLLADRNGQGEHSGLRDQSEQAQRCKCASTVWDAQDGWQVQLEDSTAFGQWLHVLRWPLGRDGEGRRDEMEQREMRKAKGAQSFISMNDCHRMGSSRQQLRGEFRERLNDLSLKELQRTILDFRVDGL